MSKVKVADVMTPMPHTVGVDQSLEVARELMRKFEIRHLPVLRGGMLVGVLSDRDIDFVLRVESRSESGKKLAQLTVEDAFSADIYTVDKGTPLQEVAENMAKRRIGCAVVEEHSKVLGIFTTVDACRVLSQNI